MERQQRETLARRVRELRGQRGWSQEELAYKAGVSSKTVSRYENPKEKDLSESENGDGPRGHQLRAVAKALGKKPEDLTGPRLTLLDAEMVEEERLERIERRLAEVLALLTKKPLTDFFPPASPSGDASDVEPKPRPRRKTGS